MLFSKKNKPNRSAPSTSDELQKLRNLHTMAQALIETYNNAVRDLDGLTVQQVEQAYHSGRLTKTEYEELSNAVAALDQIVTGHPILILNVQSKYAQEYLALSQTHDLSSFPEPSFFTS